jgi:hypothetical protein
VPAAIDHSGGTVHGEAKPIETAPQTIGGRSSEAAKPGDAKSSTVIASSTDAEKSLSPPPTGAVGKPLATAKVTASPKSGDSCARGTFAAVLGARAPGTTDVQAALARLQRCKSTMDVAVFADIQRRLIAKL